MEEDSKFYLFKALTFNIGKGKFDTKGCSITGLPIPENNEDVVNLSYLKQQIEPLMSNIKKIRDVQTQIKNDIISIETQITDLESSTKAISKVPQPFRGPPVQEESSEVSNKVELINEITKLQTSVLKEVMYEIVAKKTQIGSFAIPKRLVNSLTNKHSLANINIYSSIELLNLSTRIIFLNNNNREIHNPEFKNKKQLKVPLTIVIKSKNDSQKNNDLYSLSIKSTHSNVDLDKPVSLDYKFLERVVLEPENLSKCFLNSPSERSLHPNVREITDNVDNINLVIIFLIRLNYNIKK